jgi:hypothetical protein
MAGRRSHKNHLFSSLTEPPDQITSSYRRFGQTNSNHIRDGTLKDGREVSRKVTSFKGTPERPLVRAELQEKFLLLTQRLGRDRMLPLFDRLQAIEEEKTLDWLNV